MEIKKLSELSFRDTPVSVYYDIDQTTSDLITSFGCCWQMRNPDSSYTGLVYMNNETGKLTYPEGAIIPEQTAKDREIFPKFIVVRTPELDEETKKEILTYLDTEYNRRNK